MKGNLRFKFVIVSSGKDERIDRNRTLVKEWACKFGDVCEITVKDLKSNVETIYSEKEKNDYEHYSTFFYICCISRFDSCVDFDSHDVNTPPVCLLLGGEESVEVSSVFSVFSKLPDLVKKKCLDVIVVETIPEFSHISFAFDPPTTNNIQRNKTEPPRQIYFFSDTEGISEATITSLFTRTLVDELEVSMKKNTSLMDVFRNIRDHVRKESDEYQCPHLFVSEPEISIESRFSESRVRRIEDYKVLDLFIMNRKKTSPAHKTNTPKIIRVDCGRAYCGSVHVHMSVHSEKKPSQLPVFIYLVHIGNTTVKRYGIFEDEFSSGRNSYAFGAKIPPHLCKEFVDGVYHLVSKFDDFTISKAECLEWKDDRFVLEYEFLKDEEVQNSLYFREYRCQSVLLRNVDYNNLIRKTEDFDRIQYTAGKEVDVLVGGHVLNGKKSVEWFCISDHPLNCHNDHIRKFDESINIPLIHISMRNVSKFVVVKDRNEKMYLIKSKDDEYFLLKGKKKEKQEGFERDFDLFREYVLRKQNTNDCLTEVEWFDKMIGMEKKMLRNRNKKYVKDIDIEKVYLEAFGSMLFLKEVIFKEIDREFKVMIERFGRGLKNYMFGEESMKSALDQFKKLEDEVLKKHDGKKDMDELATNELVTRIVDARVSEITFRLISKLVEGSKSYYGKKLKELISEKISDELDQLSEDVSGKSQSGIVVPKPVYEVFGMLGGFFLGVPTFNLSTAFAPDSSSGASGDTFKKVEPRTIPAFLLVGIGVISYSTLGGGNTSDSRFETLWKGINKKKKWILEEVTIIGKEWMRQATNEFKKGFESEMFSFEGERKFTTKEIINVIDHLKGREEVKMRKSKDKFRFDTV